MSKNVPKGYSPVPEIPDPRDIMPEGFAHGIEISLHHQILNRFNQEFHDVLHGDATVNITSIIQGANTYIDNLFTRPGQIEYDESSKEKIKRHSFYRNIVKRLKDPLLKDNKELHDNFDSLVRFILIKKNPNPFLTSFLLRNFSGVVGRATDQARRAEYGPSYEFEEKMKEKKGEEANERKEYDNAMKDKDEEEAKERKEYDQAMKDKEAKEEAEKLQEAQDEAEKLQEAQDEAEAQVAVNIEVEKEERAQIKENLDREHGAAEATAEAQVARNIEDQGREEEVMKEKLEGEHAQAEADASLEARLSQAKDDKERAHINHLMTQEGNFAQKLSNIEFPLLKFGEDYEIFQSHKTDLEIFFDADSIENAEHDLLEKRKAAVDLLYYYEGAESEYETLLHTYNELKYFKRQIAPELEAKMEKIEKEYQKMSALFERFFGERQSEEQALAAYLDGTSLQIRKSALLYEGFEDAALADNIQASRMEEAQQLQRSLTEFSSGSATAPLSYEEARKEYESMRAKYFPKPSEVETADLDEMTRTPEEEVPEEVEEEELPEVAKWSLNLRIFPTRFNFQKFLQSFNASFVSFFNKLLEESQVDDTKKVAVKEKMNEVRALVDKTKSDTSLENRKKLKDSVKEFIKMLKESFDSKIIKGITEFWNMIIEGVYSDTEAVQEAVSKDSQSADELEKDVEAFEEKEDEKRANILEEFAFMKKSLMRLVEFFRSMKIGEKEGAFDKEMDEIAGLLETDNPTTADLQRAQSSLEHIYSKIQFGAKCKHVLPFLQRIGNKIDAFMNQEVTIDPVKNLFREMTEFFKAMKKLPKLSRADAREVEQSLKKVVEERSKGSDRATISLHGETSDEPIIPSEESRKEANEIVRVFQGDLSPEGATRAAEEMVQSLESSEAQPVSSEVKTDLIKTIRELLIVLAKDDRIIDSVALIWQYMKSGEMSDVDALKALVKLLKKVRASQVDATNFAVAESIDNLALSVVNGLSKGGEDVFRNLLKRENFFKRMVDSAKVMFSQVRREARKTLDKKLDDYLDDSVVYMIGNGLEEVEALQVSDAEALTQEQVREIAVKILRVPVTLAFMTTMAPGARMKVLERLEEKEDVFVDAMVGTLESRADELDGAGALSEIVKKLQSILNVHDIYIPEKVEDPFEADMVRMHNEDILLTREVLVKMIGMSRADSDVVIADAHGKFTPLRVDNKDAMSPLIPLEEAKARLEELGIDIDKHLKNIALSVEAWKDKKGNVYFDRDASKNAKATQIAVLASEKKGWQKLIPADELSQEGGPTAVIDAMQAMQAVDAEKSQYKELGTIIADYLMSKIGTKDVVSFLALIGGLTDVWMGKTPEVIFYENLSQSALFGAFADRERDEVEFEIKKYLETKEGKAHPTVEGFVKHVKRPEAENVVVIPRTGTEG